MDEPAGSFYSAVHLTDLVAPSASFELEKII